VVVPAARPKWQLGSGRAAGITVRPIRAVGHRSRWRRARSGGRRRGDVFQMLMETRCRAVNRVG
jgi:hypothetical protein